MSSMPTPQTEPSFTPCLPIDDEALTDADRETIRLAAKVTACRFPPMRVELAKLVRHILRGDTT